MNTVVVLVVSLCAGPLLFAEAAKPKGASVKVSVTSNAQPGSKNPHSSKHRISFLRSHGKRPRGQANIDGRRTNEIQSALIREHYLNGSPSGTWDDATQKAMKRYQADHGWQSKTTPDARALIKLGLGPDQEHLLNPESAMTSQPVSPRSASVSPSAVSENPANEKFHLK